MTPAIERLGKGEIIEISAKSAALEWGRRRPEYSLFWWPGRRLLGGVRAVLAALAVPDPRAAIDSIDGVGVEKLRKFTAGRLVVDPFSGGGTIPLEASRMGYEAVGLDSNPYAVSVSRASRSLLNGECRTKSACLVEAARRVWRSLYNLWCGEGFCIIHVLLARCPPCTAPAWVSRLRNGINLLLDGRTLRPASGINVSPKEPMVSLPEGLPEEAPGYVAYAAEVLTAGGRRWVYLGDDGLGARVASHLRSTLPRAVELVSGLPGVPVPPGKETSKLLAAGIQDFKHIYTPRQLATISDFVNNASSIGCRLEASCIAGSSSRASSLLAIYYQPARRVNPAFIVKTYWVPANPVELNPLASTCMPGPPSTRCKPLGRGGLWSLVKRYSRGCSSVGGRLEFRVWDSSRGLPPGMTPYAVVTDPPYPGMQSYGQLSLVYSLPHRLAGLPVPSRWVEVDSMSRGYVDAITRSLRLAGMRLEKDGYMAILLSSGTERGAGILAKVIHGILYSGLKLAIILPLAGESPGRLGRSFNKLVYVVVFKRGAPTTPNPLRPLEWAADVGEAAGYRPDEVRVSSKVAEALASELEDLLKAGG
ncbi:SAM-dependent methyltransferase [Aeropyrum camini]|uniref:Uncharacterized protein n=1 Tax=Aeropyrum camini SY1 = JCM 12091 TaxID=1198449 RepID=U3TBV6_9CREN|nr:SAM-dependent methyltransferase [Aeropyrum camini]BAN89525.1 hypothetical protein ACAM_0056 [Aeropyrum camini SY1 = JCM 12091]